MGEWRLSAPPINRQNFLYFSKASVRLLGTLTVRTDRAFLSDHATPIDGAYR